MALALGMGTMVGWKRIVVTVGEKIGKEHLTYAQGACAELVAMGTIFAADNFGLPVSTTHVLSSGVAGTMAANRQRPAVFHHPQYRRGLGLYAAGGGAALGSPVLALPPGHALSSLFKLLSKGRPASSGRLFPVFNRPRSRATHAGPLHIRYHT